MEQDKRFELENGIAGTVSQQSISENLPITYLDEVEDDCWLLFKKYAEMAGVVFDDGEVDFSIAKSISEYLICTVENVFDTTFPLRAEDGGKQ